MKPISRIETDEPVVALTFDDGPHKTQTFQYLELFKKEGVKATFVETGKNLSRYPGLVIPLTEAGHKIGNHSMTHPPLSKLETEQEIRAEIEETQKLILKDCGVSPRIFRAPSFDYDDRVIKVLEVMNLPIIGASESAHDWSPEASVEVALERVTS